MSPPALGDLLARRLELVSRLSRETAALQRLQRTRASAEMDAQRCESGLDREQSAETTRELARDLLEARERMAESDRGMERCEAEILGLEFEPRRDGSRDRSRRSRPRAG